MNLILSVYSSALCSGACQIVLFTIKSLSSCSMSGKWFLSRGAGGSSQVLGTQVIPCGYRYILKHPSEGICVWQLPSQ